ncbi:MAG: hypothetical protein M0Z53_07265 [Thermaerobacter sp.]|nr:hypothetical protein [Thermaerobacter sp.]
MGSVVIVGMGQLGRTVAEGWLLNGLTVVPVLRRSPPASLADRNPQAVLVATGEDDLDGALASLPEAWRDRVILLQNELVPQQWEFRGISEPTIFVVWFEKKPGQLIRPLLPSVLYGPQAALLGGALEALGLPFRLAEDRDILLFELAVKNTYILTTNIAGLAVGGTTGELWQTQRQFALELMDEIVRVQNRLMDRHFDQVRMTAALAEALNADPRHVCGGRSAKRRLARLLQHAERLAMRLPRIEGVAAGIGAGVNSV